MWKEDEEVVTPQQEEQEKKAYIDALNGLTTGVNENYTSQIEDNQSVQDYLPFQIDHEDDVFFGNAQPALPDNRPQVAKDLENYYNREALAQELAQQRNALDDFNRQQAINDAEYYGRMAKPFQSRSQNEQYNSVLSEMENDLIEGNYQNVLKNAGWFPEQFRQNAERADALNQLQRNYDNGIADGEWQRQRFQNEAQKALYDNSVMSDIYGQLARELSLRRQKNIEEGGNGVFKREVAEHQEGGPYSAAQYDQINPYFDSQVAHDYVTLPNGLAAQIPDFGEDNSQFGDPFTDPMAALYAQWGYR